MVRQRYGMGGFSIVRVLAGVGFLALLIGYTIYHANFVLGRSLLFAFPEWEVTYRSAWPSLGGGVVATDVTMVPPAGEDAGKFHFDRVRVEVPFFEYYRSGFSRERGSLLRAINNIRLVFENGRGDLTYPFSREMALVGNASAAPFEAEGCAEDDAWLSTELDDMGLATGGTELVMSYHLEPGRLVKEQSIHKPGAGRVDFRREMIKHDNNSLFSLIESGRSEVASDEWRVQDEGFVAARNRYCTNKDKVTPAEFAQRHVATVKRLLQTVGLAPQAELEANYAKYASQGGAFALLVHYDPPIGAPLYSEQDLGKWLPRISGTFSLNGQSHALALESMPPRELPDGDEDATTFALMQRENAPETTSAAVAATTIAVSATPAQKAPAPANQPTSSPPPAAPLAAAPAQKPSTPIPAPLVSATDSIEPPVATAEQDKALDYRHLANYVGRSVMVFQKGREAARVEIVRVADKGEIVIRRHSPSGFVEYTLDRASFDHAEE